MTNEVESFESKGHQSKLELENLKFETEKVVQQISNFKIIVITLNRQKALNLLLGRQRQSLDKHGISFKENNSTSLKSQTCLDQDLFWDQTLIRDLLLFLLMWEKGSYGVFLSF